MSEVSQGPGWWQASDLKWYPPERQPNYATPPPPPSQPSPSGYHIPAAGQAPAIPHGTTPAPQPAAYAQNQAGGAHTAADGLAAAKVLLANLSVTTGLLYGGLIIAVIGILCPWVTISEMGIDVASAGGPNTGWKFGVLLVIAAAAWLAWPALSGIRIPVNRLIGLTVAVGALLLVVIIGFYDVSSFSSDVSKNSFQIVHASPGFGLWLYAAAVVASVAGIVRIWIHHSKTQGQAA